MRMLAGADGMTQSTTASIAIEMPTDPTRDATIIAIERTPGRRAAAGPFIGPRSSSAAATRTR
jgi:hypothetical protein